MALAADSTCDVLIIGAGIFGISTAYHLSLTHSDPSRITVLDRAEVPSPQAASSDMNKIVRSDYSKAFYMDLAEEAMTYWSESPAIRAHFHRTGWVILNEEKSDLTQRIQENFQQSGRLDTSREIDVCHVKTLWEGALSEIETRGYSKAYTNTSVGWVDASSAIKAMMKEATYKGVNYLVGEMTEFVHDGQRLTGIKTADGATYSAKKILLATGAWTPWLMASLEAELKIIEQNTVEKQICAAGVCVAAFKLSDKELQQYSKMPVLVYGENGEVIPPNKDGFLKFTNAKTFLNTKYHPTGRQISVPAENQKEIPDGLKTECMKIIRQRIPQLLRNGRAPEYWRICYDAVSPDQNQLICQHPHALLQNLYLATAGSFHSWKFLPNIGIYVANVLNGKSNGEERDSVWMWKTKWSDQGAHESVLPRCELRDFS